MDDLRKRRLSYSEMCNLAMEEQGYDKETFSKFAEVNPTVYEMSTFINSLSFKGYDDFRKFTALAKNIVLKAIPKNHYLSDYKHTGFYL